MPRGGFLGGKTGILKEKTPSNSLGSHYTTTMRKKRRVFHQAEKKGRPALRRTG